MTWRQTFVMAFVIVLLCSALVWFLEDFERKRVTSGVAREWLDFINEQGVRPDGGGQ